MVGKRDLLKKLYGDASVAEIIKGVAIPRLHYNSRSPWRNTCEVCGVSLVGKSAPPPWTDSKDTYDSSPYKCGGG